MSARRLRLRDLALGALALGLLCAGLCLNGAARAAGSADACTPWPGEMSEGATSRSPDPLIAAWAEARAAALRELARALAPHDAVEAWRLYAHASCLDPSVPAPAPPPPVHLSSPREVGVPAPARPLPRLAASMALLGEPVPLRTREPLDPPPLEFDFAEVDARLAAAQRALGEARFRDATLDAAFVRSKLVGLDALEPVQRRRAQLEVVAATAQLALGRAGDAQASLERALEADPYLTLDPERSSPKVLRLLETVRRDRQGAGT